MKKIVYLSALALFASCSTNKYAAHFTHYDRHENYATVQTNNNHQLTPIEPATLTASLESKPVVVESVSSVIKPEKKEDLKFTKQERNLVRAQLKKELKSFAKIKQADEAKVVNASGGWDHDLKLAAIFGAVGVVGLIISTSPFNIIGAIALIIGVVFFVKWLMRQ